MDQQERWSLVEMSDVDGNISWILKVPNAGEKVVQYWGKLWRNEHLPKLPKPQLMKLRCLLPGSGSECALSFKKPVFGFWSRSASPLFKSSWAVRPVSCMAVSLIVTRRVTPRVGCAAWRDCPALSPRYPCSFSTLLLILIWHIYINSLF